jgi:hypothetical protein
MRRCAVWGTVQQRNALVSAEPRQMSATRYPPDRQYQVFLLKAWTKDTLAEKISRALDPYPPDAIVSVEARVDFQFFVPWRRDWALIVVRKPEAAHV